MAKSPKYDPQREEVYAWEKKFANACCGDMGTKPFYSLLRKVCKHYDVPRPRASGTFKAEENFAAVCDPWTGEIRFGKRWCSAHVLLHELAHWILIKLGCPGEEFHNGLWLGLFMRLMHEGQVLPWDASVPSARQHGLDFVDPKECGPTNLRRLIAIARS